MKSMIKVNTFHNSILRSCSYCIYDDVSFEGYLVDVGDVEPILSFIKSNHILIEGVFLTHPHFDHVYGITEFINYNPSVRIFCSEEALSGLKNEDVNMSYMYLEDEFNLPPDERFEIINSDSRLTCFSFPLQIISCPGHDTGCLSYIIGDNIFTGDSYTPFAPVTYNWHRCDKQQALENEAYIREIIKVKGLKVYPGHYQE